MAPAASARGSRPSRRRGGRPDRGGVLAASYARYSSDLQDDSSIEQQQRQCRDRAADDGYAVPAEFEFADRAVSGTRPDRNGLGALMHAARGRAFHVLYIHCLSRLARESVISLPVLKELVHVCGVRVVSIADGIDTDNPNWELSAIIRCWMHQESLSSLRAAVLRGQEEAVLHDYSVGDWCFGYASEPVPGSAAGRRGRNAKPRKRYVVHEEHAGWVREIFRLFVEERRGLNGIARELNRRNAPKDHRATTRGWHPDYVRRVLENRKYIGVWPWGRRTNVRNPLTGQVRQEERPAGAASRLERERPRLRLVDDATFFRAQALLAENQARFAAARGAAGRLSGSAAGAARPRHLLQGLVRCGHCGGPFQVNGARYLSCAGAKRGLCVCTTRLPRALAGRLILGAVGERLLGDPRWAAAVLAEARAAWEARRRSAPGEREGLERALADVEQKIARLVDRVEAGGDPDLGARLAQRQRERQALRDRLRALAAGPADAGPPTAAWVEGRLRALSEVLADGGAAGAEALRQLIGAVTVTQAERSGKRRQHLRGTFRLSAAALAGEGAGAAAGAGGQAEEVTLVFARPRPWEPIADAVKELYDRGLGMMAIGAELGVNRNLARKALVFWHRQRGLEPPDGRAAPRPLTPPPEPPYKRAADDVKALLDEGLYLKEAAARLGLGRATAEAAARHWYASRGLPVPDWRARRGALHRPRRRRTRPGGGPPDDAPEAPAGAG